jgi:hypothetical protein
MLFPDPDQELGASRPSRSCSPSFPWPLVPPLAPGLTGTGGLAGQFADAGLVHDVIVAIAPVTLGAGAPLLPRRIEL